MDHTTTTSTRIIKGYELREAVRMGAVGTVYRAYQPSVRRQVLVRVIPPEVASQPDFVPRFDAEALRVARLEHPHILPLHDYWQDETGAYMVARWLPRTLGDSLADGPWPLDAGVRLAEQLAAALDAAHQAGIVHHGVAPDLVLLDDHNNAYLAGFIIAQMGLTAPTTSPYLAPEQLAGLPATPKADLYGLGILVYEVLTGVVPEHGGEELPPLRTWQPGLPAALDAVLQTATARQPEHRFSDGRRFAAALRAATAQAARAQPLIDPLTERELDILTLMVQGRDNADIAKHLVLSASTVKWYVKQIYSKLDAHSRDEAVDRAKALGLVGTKETTAPEPVTVVPTPHSEGPGRGLPSFSLPFIGRERALADLTALLHDPSRSLISIVAPGGMGKTRLAIEAARAAAPAFPDGVVYVPLTAATEAQFPEAVLQALGILVAAEKPVWEQIVAYCAPRRLLLVLDNFEAVLLAGRLVAELLGASPHARALVTSRERLLLEPETVYPLGSMESPPENGGPPTMVESMELFIERARRVRYGFAADEGNLPAIADICRLVDGMPLAIVLAASWAELLSPAEIAAEIRASAEFLAAEYADLPERQRSIRIVFESAWEHLTEGERRTFARLSVFRGGFTRGAASVVTGATLRTLAALVTKALIWTDEGGRYILHELLRQFAAERLANAGEVDALREGHSRYMLEWAVRMEAEICGANPAPAMDAIDADWHNLRAALLWAAEHGRPEWITPAWKPLWLYHERHARVEAGIALLEEVATQLRRHPEGQERDRALGAVLLSMAMLTVPVWDFARRDDLLKRARPLLEGTESSDLMATWYMCRGCWIPYTDVTSNSEYLLEALARFRATGDRWSELYSLCNLSWVSRWMDDPEPNQHLIQTSAEVQAMALETGDLLLQAYVMNTLGNVEDYVGRSSEAIALFNRAAVLARRGGHPRLECNNMSNAALFYMNAALDTAEALWEAVLAIQRKLIPLACAGLDALGEVFLRKGEFERARPLFAEGEARAVHSAHPVWVFNYLLYRARLAYAVGQYEALQRLTAESAAVAQESGMSHKRAFAPALVAYAAFAQDDEPWARSALATIEAQANTGNGAPAAALGLAIRAELNRRNGDPAGAADDLRAALLMLASGSLEPMETGWEDSFASLQIRGLLVRALLDTGELDEARTVALTALDNAYAIKAPPFVMGALLACARVEAASGEVERAVEVAALIADSPRAFAPDRLGAQALLEQLESEVPADVLASASEKDRMLDWEQAAADRLALTE